MTTVPRTTRVTQADVLRWRNWHKHLQAMRLCPACGAEVEHHEVTAQTFCEHRDACEYYRNLHEIVDPDTGELYPDDELPSRVPTARFTLTSRVLRVTLPVTEDDDDRNREFGRGVEEAVDAWTDALQIALLAVGVHRGVDLRLEVDA